MSIKIIKKDQKNIVDNTRDKIAKSHKELYHCGNITFLVAKSLTLVCDRNQVFQFFFFFFFQILSYFPASWVANLIVGALLRWKKYPILLVTSNLFWYWLQYQLRYWPQVLANLGFGFGIRPKPK